jgi:hypothetical protein
MYYFLMDACISNSVQTDLGILSWTLVLFFLSTFCLETKGGAKNSRLLLFRLIPNPFL